MTTDYHAEMLRESTCAVPLSWDRVLALIGNHFGTFDVPCPECGAFHRPRRPEPFRIWRAEEHFATFCCQRCGFSGYARDSMADVAPPDRAKLTAARVQHMQHQADDRHERMARAGELWEQAKPLTPGMLGWRYFTERRRLPLDQLGDLDHAIRWHHRKQAVVACMRDPVTDQATGVHRTFLAPDGSKTERKMLGPAGAIKLSPDEDVCLGLGIVEGLEDGLRLLSLNWRPIWVLGSAGAIERFPVLGGIEHLTIFDDRDATGLKAATACAVRWRRYGRSVTVIPPPPGSGAKDWDETHG